MVDSAPQSEIKHHRSAGKPLLPAQPVRVDALLPLTPTRQALPSDPDSPESGTTSAVTMVIRFVCLHCGVHLSVPAGKVGKWVRCKQCEHRVRVPNQTPVPGQPRMTERRVDQHIRRRRRKARPEQPTSTDQRQLQSPPTETQPCPQPATTPRYKLKSLSPDDSGIAPAPAPVPAPKVQAQAESVLPAKSTIAVNNKPSLVGLTQRITDLLKLLAQQLSRLRPATSSTPAATTMLVVSLYGDLMLAALLAGVLWWSIVWFTGLEFAWLALLPGVALGVVVTVRMRQMIHERWRTALAITGVTLILGHGLILGTTQADHEARLLADDAITVRRAVMLDMIAQQQIPGELRQTITQNGWYTPQNPDTFFDRVSLPVYDQLETLAKAKVAQMSQGQLRHVLIGYLRDSRETSAGWLRRVQRLSWLDGVFGLLSMTFAAGLPMVVMKCLKVE